MKRRHRLVFLSAAFVAVLLTSAASTVALADVVNGGFELGLGLGVADNATDWDWTPDSNGERVNALTTSNANDGSGTLGTHLIDPLAGDWFGYAENSETAINAEISQSVLINAQTPLLTFWWRFFTNETTGVSTTFNDRFQVNVEGSGSLLQTIASVNGTPMTTVGGPLFSAIGSPGLGQSFANFTSAWAFASVNVASMAGENVTVTFRIADVGGDHNQSSGFALDKIEFIVPEPNSLAIACLGVCGAFRMVRRRRK